jgi:hypothetical protein
LATEPAPLCPLDEVEIGDRAVARTVLRGEEIVEFPVEILGFLKDFLGPGQDLILGRLGSEPVEWTGVVGGMSGSPVYLDGRLVGAVSYRFGLFNKEPIAGITPIDQVLDSPAPGLPVGSSSAQPLATPLVMVGLPPAARRHYGPLWRDEGLEPMEGASTAGQVGGVLVPGAPVAAVLASGDATLAATGTVTRVEGDRVWAFGHPFLGEGEANLPMARAEIVWTLATWIGSNKMSSIGEVVGVIRQDRLGGVQGVIGARAVTMSLEVLVKREGWPDRASRYELLRHRRWTPLLVETLVGTTLYDAQDLEARESYRATGRLELENGSGFDLDLLVPNPDERINGPFLLAREVSRRVRLATDTPFGALPAESMTLVVEPLAGTATERVEDLALGEMRVRPGQTLAVLVYLRDADGHRRAVSLELTVPPETRPGTVELHAGSEADLDAVFGSPSEAGRRTAQDLESWLQEVRDHPRDHGLVLRLARRAEGAVLGGRRYPSLPETVARTLRSRPGGARGYRLKRTTLAEVRRDTATSLEGTHMVTLDVVADPGGIE